MVASVNRYFKERSLPASFWRLISIVTIFVYLTIHSFSVTHGFFWADDSQSLSFVRNLPGFWSLFGPDAFGLFRPVKNLLWAFFSFVSDFGVEWCRLFAIGIGAISFFPVRSLCRRIFQSEGKAIAAAALWLLSPTLVSSTAWLSGVNIQLMAAFSAAAIACHDSAWDNGRFRGGRVGLACLFLFLALVSYECAVAVVPILLLFDVLLRTERLKNPRTWRIHLGYWIVLGFYFVLRALSSSRMEMRGSWVEADRWQRIVSSPFFTVQHFSTWFWPFGRFTVLGGYRWGDASPWALAASWLAVIAVLGCAYLCRRRFPVLAFCILFAAIGFAPTSNCLGSGNGPYGDYYVTLASIGVAAGCVEAACLVSKAGGKLRFAGAVAVCVFAAIRVVTVFEAARWARLWGNGELAFAESVRNYPEYVSNKISFVQFLADEGRYEEALDFARQIEQATDPGSSRMAVVHLVRALHAINVVHNPETALAELNLCQEAGNPSIPPKMIDYYRGCVFEDLLSDVDRAKNQYEKALSSAIDFELVPCADRLARIWAIQGRRDEAISLWERALHVDPENVSVLWNLCVAHQNAGNPEKAKSMKERLDRLTGN